MVDGQALSNVVALASGEGFVLALKKEGTVVAWGDNYSGATAVPAGLSNVVAIAAARQALALKRDGTVVAWGAENHWGETSVPAGLSNVVAIAATSDFSLAVITGKPPASVFIQPHGRLEIMALASDLVFKGRVISTHAETNAAFPDWGKPYATRFEVISVLKGSTHTNEIVFHHNTSGPGAWGGGTEPSHNIFDVGQSYIIFASKADKPDYLYSPSSNNIARPDEFRQIMQGDFALRTLDSRPLDGLSVRAAGWLELNRLLTSTTPSNLLYAIQHLNKMSKSCLASWGHDDDFKREAVLKAVLPFMTNDDDRVAVYAIVCFQLGGNTGTFLTDQGGWMPILRGCSEVQPECVAQASPYAATLVNVANKSSSLPRRVAAIAAFSCTQFSVVSNALPQWLGDADERIRAQAVLLLPDFPGEWSEQLLRKQDMDSSPKVRSIVATAIGNGQMERLIPVLVKQFSEPLGPTNPIPPLTLDDLQSGGQLDNLNVGDVHTCAGYALLKFDVNQVGDILKTKLNDIGFRVQFLCKLAENNPGPWLTNLVGELKTWRGRTWKEVDTSANEPKTNYFQARITLTGAYFTCWNMIYHHIADLPDSAFADGKLDWVLDTLEDAGSSDSNRPIEIYKLYRSKGLNDRAARLRRENGKYNRGYDLSQFFDRVDAEKSKQ